MTPNEIRTRARSYGVHEAEARELYLFSLNTAEPYHKMVEQTISSLRRHAGDYDSDSALLSWKRVADYMAKEYCRMYCGKDQPWFSVFAIEDRCRCAVELENSEKDKLNEEKTK